MHFFNYNSSVHGYNTRQSQRGDIFMVQTNNSLYGLQSIRYLGAKSWNELPMEIRNLSSKNVFAKMSPSFLKIGMRMLSFHFSSIFSCSKMCVSTFRSTSTAVYPNTLHASTGMSSGPVAFPLFIFFSASSTLPFVISSTCVSGPASTVLSSLKIRSPSLSYRFIICQ